jgi:tungstate transport system ATP-binding protein
MKVENIIRIENLLVQRGGVTVLDIKELTVERGKIFALIGPNGAGKSTLLLTLAGLLRPQQGQLYFQGQPVDTNAGRAILRRNAAVVFQEPLLLSRSVYENVSLGLKFRQAGKDEIKKRVQESLDYFGIAQLEKRLAKSLSGGEARRVSLARAFALKPQLILLDEPFNSLDPPTREAVIDDLQRILKETKITAVMALQDREETLRLAQDVAFMSDGKIVQSGTTAEIFNQPADEFIANFVGTESVLEGTVESNTNGLMGISINGKVIEVVGGYAIGQRVYCCLRPENVTLSKEKQGKISARNVFEAKVRKIVRQGFFYKLILDCGFPLTAYITQSSCEDLQLEEGASVITSFKATAVHVMRREK